MPCHADTLSPASGISNLVRLGDHEVHARTGKVRQIGRRGLALRRSHRRLKGRHGVERQHRDQISSVLAGRAHHVTLRDFIAAQARQRLGQRHMLGEVVVVECGGVGGLLVDREKLGHGGVSGLCCRFWAA